MGIRDLLSGITPDPVENFIFGKDEAPPTPTNPEQARQLIDNVIGRQPSDRASVDLISNMGLMTKVVNSLQEYGLGLPYDDDTMARVATNNMNAPVEPYISADQIIGKWLQANPRRQALYMREQDPLNPLYIPYVVEANIKHHDGILSKAKNLAGDLLGRPIGGALELLAKPAREAEIWYGTNFVWNDIGDASLRHAMAKYTYEARLNVKDWNMTWESQARAKSQEIENQGLKGDAAASAFKDWIKTDGRPKVSAYVTDMFAQMVFDPLWLVPGSVFESGVKGATKALTGTEDIGKLSRLGTAAGRAYAGEHSLKALTTLSELNYVEAKLASPGARGSLMWLTERSPDRLADAAYSRAADALSGPLYASTDPMNQMEILARFNDMMRSGTVTDKAAELFGRDLLSAPVMAEAAKHVRDSKANLIQGMLEGVEKNPEYLMAPPKERAFLLSNHVLGNLRSAVREGQLRFYPKWFTQRYLPIVAAQKMAMGVFTLSRPGFIVLNMANNWFTYMWHAAGQPMDGMEIFGRSLGAELSSLTAKGGHVPEYFKNLARAANVDPLSIERTVVGNVSHIDVLGQRAGYPFRLDDETVDVADAIKKANKAVTAPIKDLNPRRFRDMVAFPVTAAGRVDRMTRRAAYYYNLKQQVGFTTLPERLLTKGVPGSKGGIMPDIKDALLKANVPAEQAEFAEHFLHNHMSEVLRSGKISLGDQKSIRKAYAEGVAKMLKDTPAARLSAMDMGMRFMQKQGYASDQAMLEMSNLSDVQVEIQKIFNEADNIPLEQTAAKLEKLANDYWTTDRIQADLTHTAPVLRAENDYAAGLQATEEGFRADATDHIMHIERFLDTKAPFWSGNQDMRRKVMSAMEKFSVGRIQRLGQIRESKLNLLAKGIKVDETKLWEDYFGFVDDTTKELYTATKEALGAVDVTNLKPLDAWYEDALRTQARHREIIKEARRTNTKEGWNDAGKAVSKVFRDSANRRAGKIFGWQPNEPAMNLGHMRGSAAYARQVDEYISFIKSKLGEEMAKSKVPHWANALRQVAPQAAIEAGKRGPEVARHISANARIATDFVMLNYNNQYGIDSALQMIFPYEFFPTRTAANWTRRVMKSPGMGAALSIALLNPAQYAKDYGLPDRLAYRIPVPIPGLENFMENIPVIGDKVKNGNFGPVYWIDPLNILFPMANFRDTYNDEQKQSTPLGIVANWTEQNTPLSLSPFAKIVGGISGALDRDAWTNSLFSGGPFGIPLSVYAKATTAWLQTGVPDGVPDDEKDNYTNGGFFSSQWLGRVIGLTPDKFDVYRTERSLASMVAEGKIEPDAAWEALRLRSGDAWDQAQAAGNSEDFLAKFTGWIGLRVVGSQKGEQIRLGEQALFEKAASEGKLEEFYTAFPEYELQSVASKGLSDPEGRKQLMDNHFYFSDYEKLVNKPYQYALDQIDSQLNNIRSRSNITETDKEQERYLVDELQQIKEEQNSIRDMLDKAYPNRTKTTSLNIPPRERALQRAANDWFDIKRDPNESQDAFDARRNRFLAQFPAKTGNETEQDWQALFISYQATAAAFNLKINNAYDAGEFDKGRALRNQKEQQLTQIHSIAQGRLTRYDVEQYLASFQRVVSPAEQEWNQANALFDLWMSYVSDSSPLSSRQKAAISAYFRQDPLLKKHYNVGTIDLSTLNGDQLLALARRREIKNRYYDLDTNAAKVDYIQAVKDEYNSINAILGLPPLEVLDYRPAPPDIHFRDISDAALDFSTLVPGANEVPAGYYQDPLNALLRSEQGLSPADVARYVDPVAQRGY